MMCIKVCVLYGNQRDERLSESPVFSGLSAGFLLLLRPTLDSLLSSDPSPPVDLRSRSADRNSGPLETAHHTIRMLIVKRRLLVVVRNYDGRKGRGQATWFRKSTKV